MMTAKPKSLILQVNFAHTTTHNDSVSGIRQPLHSVLDPERADRRRRALRAILALHGLSLNEAAKRFGIKSAALGNFLHGRAASLSLETLEPIAQGLGTTLDELVGWELPQAEGPPLKISATISAPSTEIDEENHTRISFDLAGESEVIQVFITPIGGAPQIALLVMQILQILQAAETTGAND